MSFYFDGVDDYIRVERSSRMEPAQRFTIACWARRDGTPEDYGTLIEKSIGQTNLTPEVSYAFKLNGAIVDEMFARVGWVGNTSWTSNGGFSNCADQTWQFYAWAVESQATTLDFYWATVNTGLSSDKDQAGGGKTIAYNSSYDFTLGAAENDTFSIVNHWKGDIAGVAMWNVKLEQADIAAYARCSYLPAPGALQLYMPMDYGNPRDVVGNFNVKVNGGAKPSAAPPIRLPLRGSVIIRPAASGGSTAPPTAKKLAALGVG